MSEFVYEEWGCELVCSSHSEDETINYRVFWGTVNWSRTTDGLQPALVIFMQYGGSVDFSVAKRKGEIKFQMPAHILPFDLSAVVAAAKRLQTQFSSTGE